MQANLATLLVAPWLTSCGVMMVPGPFHVPVDSEPSGATVVYAGKKVGVTPCVVAMQRASSALELRRDGYHPRIVEVGTKANRWVAGNVATFGLGMFLDMELGGHMNLIDDPVLVVLASTDHPQLDAWVRVGPATDTPRACWCESPSPWTFSRRTAHDNGTGQLMGSLVEALFECLFDHRHCW